jgi:hypothetical protein
LEVVHPRKLTALEWAVLRVADAFRDEPPGLEEAAEELGIGDAAFLRDTLRDVVRLRALEPHTKNAPWSDLPDLVFTDTGHQLFSRGQIESEPAEHGEDLYFDALTDESRPEPKGAQEKTDTPFPASAPTLQPRDSVGLDRVREIVLRFHPDLVKGDGEVRSVQPRSNSWPRIVWVPTDIELRLSERGALSPASPSLSEAAITYIESVDPIEENLVPGGFTTVTWADAGLLRTAAQLSFDAWRHLASRTLATGDVQREVLRLVGTAHRELVLYAGWYVDPAVQARVAELARAGVRVLVLGSRETAVIVLNERPIAGFVFLCASPRSLPAAVVVDGQSGLIVDDVVLRYGETRPVVELAGVMTPAGCKEVAAQFLSALTEALADAGKERAPPRVALRTVENVDAVVDKILEDASLRMTVVRLAVSRDETDFAACVRRVSILAPGPERVRALVRLGSLASSLVEGLPVRVAAAPALETWRTLVDQVRTDGGSSALYSQLAELAPEGADAGELVSAALDGWMARLTPSLKESSEILLTLRRIVDARWGRDACQRIARYTAHRDQLIAPGIEQTHDLASRLTVAKQLLDAAELRRWGTNELQALGAPDNARALETWIAQAEHLTEIIREDVRARAGDYVRRLLRARPGELDDLLRASQGMVDLSTLLDAVVPSTPSLQDLRDARRRTSAAGLKGDASVWRPWIERSLPEPATLGSTAAAVDVVRDLTKLGEEDAALAAVGRAWAAKVVEGLPPPEAPSALTWWLSELVPLRPLLGDVAPRATQHLRRFQGPLRTARQDDAAVWNEVRQAWGDLGLPIAELEGMLVEQPRAKNDAPGNQSRHKKRKRRR